jgi:hypothetical protein
MVLFVLYKQTKKVKAVRSSRLTTANTKPACVKICRHVAVAQEVPLAHLHIQKMKWKDIGPLEEEFVALCPVEYLVSFLDMLLQLVVYNPLLAHFLQVQE